MSLPPSAELMRLGQRGRSHPIMAWGWIFALPFAGVLGLVLPPFLADSLSWPRQSIIVSLVLCFLPLAAFELRLAGKYLPTPRQSGAWATDAMLGNAVWDGLYASKKRLLPLAEDRLNNVARLHFVVSLISASVFIWLAFTTELPALLIAMALLPLVAARFWFLQHHALFWRDMGTSGVATDAIIYNAPSDETKERYSKAERDFIERHSFLFPFGRRTAP